MHKCTGKSLNLKQEVPHHKTLIPSELLSSSSFLCRREKAQFLCFFALESQTMQYVILTYMKHLGVKVKEPREHKRGLMNFLPKIKVQPPFPPFTHTSIHLNFSEVIETSVLLQVKRPEKHLLSQILNPPRRLSKVDSTSGLGELQLNPNFTEAELRRTWFTGSNRLNDMKIQ